MANDMMEAQTASLQAQKEILSNGEQLRVTLRDSTQGLQSLFSDLSSVSREQQVALSELFNRISFMQSFLLMEAYSLSSCCYNAAALCTSYLITSTPRSSRARLVLLALVCLNFYLEKKIYQFVLSSDHPEHLHVELVSAYVGMLRRLSVCVGVCVLLLVCARYRDPVQQSLQVLQQLRETHKSLQEALQRAERLADEKKLEDCQLDGKRSSETKRAERLEESTMISSLATDSFHLSPLERTGSPSGQSIHLLHHSTSHHASVQSPGRHPPPSSPLVYSVLVENRKPQPRYSLRNRRSDVF
ncbi:hypothetical protein CRENBAI_010262 [Crenichthys baileyi]|uniref:Uncharacterized protein n=1 Tax=Crenichthys baileyi TaxID=28760 RepID=A0AAV9R0N1_9TELE